MATLTLTCTPDIVSATLPVTTATISIPDASLPLLIHGAGLVLLPGQAGATPEQVEQACATWAYQQLVALANSANQNAAAAAAIAATPQI
jgi:hypothetical protein